MEHHWTNRLQYASNEPLRQAWIQLASALGRQILNHDDHNTDTDWTILQLPTGSGKSQGTTVYCSMLARHPESAHPGVLIVTRLITEADALAMAVNDLTGRNSYAFSYHSEKHEKGILESLQTYPVLIITHRAYELALDRLSQHANGQTWKFFHSWRDTNRQIVVIDEAMDIVEESFVNLDGLRATLGAIPQEVRERFSDEVAAIADITVLLEKIARDDTAPSKEAILPNRTIKSGNVIDLSELRIAMKEVRHDLLHLGYEDLNVNKTTVKTHDDRLRSLQNIYESWNYYAKVPNHGHTLNTAKLLVPDGVKGAVVLDATASANVMYDLFDKAHVLKPPVGIRSYKNVTLYVSKGQRVGKLHLRKHGDSLVDLLITDLNSRLNGRNALVVTHKDIEAKLHARKTDFTMKTGHWGAVDGSNAWRDCDSAVIFGLPTRPTTWTANTFFALKGVRDTEWLRKKKRPFAGHDDIRSALRAGQTVTEVVQAINRIRCRKVIDSDGNCPSADIYILVPDGPQGNDIIKGITDLMDGIRVQPWELKGLPEKTKKRGRPSGSGSVQNAVSTYLKNMTSPSISVSMLKKELTITDSAMKRLIAAIKDKDADLAKTLASYGISYMTEGFGRGAKSYFLKQ